MELSAQRVDLSQGRVSGCRDRVRDHPRLRALHPVNLAGLVLDREVAVHDAQSTLAGHGDGHPGLGDGVHRGRYQWQPDGDVAGQPGRGVDLAGDDVGSPGEQQHVVEGQAQSSERCGERGRNGGIRGGR